MKEAHLMEQDTYEKVILNCKFKKEHGWALGVGGMMRTTQMAEYRGSKINTGGEKKAFYFQC